MISCRSRRWHQTRNFSFKEERRHSGDRLHHRCRWPAASSGVIAHISWWRRPQHRTWSRARLIVILFTGRASTGAFRQHKSVRTTGDKRMAIAPDMPIFADTAVPALSFSGWDALFAARAHQRRSSIDSMRPPALADLTVRSRPADLGKEAFLASARRRGRSPPCRRPRLRNGGRSSRSLGSRPNEAPGTIVLQRGKAGFHGLS
jgi:hypothetical protein